MATRASQGHPPLSQELDARFSVFLNPIRDLTKNWEVDIAKYLEEYLEELAEVRLSFDGGVTSMNFAEAAMLIQGSVTIYSKKVDFLWQMVLKTLDLLSSRRALESDGGALEAAGGGGGRKSRMELVFSFSCVDNIQVSHNIELQEDESDDHDSRRKSVQFLPSTPLNLVEKEVEKSQNRISLQIRNNEVLGAKDDFWLTRSYLTPKGVLHLEVPGEMLGAVSQVEEVGVATNIPDLEINPPPEQVDDPPSEEDQPPPEEGQLPTEDDPPSPAEDSPSPAEDPPPPAEDPPLPPEDPPPPPEDPPLPPEDLDHKHNNNNNNNDSPNNIKEQRYGLRKRHKDDKEVLATLKLTDKLKPFDPNADCPPKRPPRAGRLRVPTPCPCHRPSESKRKKNQKNKKMVCKNYIPLEEFITGELKDVLNRKSKKDRTKKVPAEILEKVHEEETNRIKEVKNNLVNHLSEEGADKEEALQAAEEAGQKARVSPQLEDDDDDSLANDAPIDLDLEDIGFVLPEAHLNKHLPESTVPVHLNDSVASEEPASEYEALVLKWVADYVNSAQESIKSTELERRVNQWRNIVLPKLQMEEERTEFDIHRYGSQILSQFPSDGRKPTIPFRQLMVGTKDTKEVARFFLSCLMLANSHNIELSQTDPDDLAMDCLELTLKSRLRHHEELEEYAAPSQADTTRSSEMDMEYIGSKGPPGVCADITQSTNLQNAANITAKKGCGKKRALPR